MNLDDITLLQDAEPFKLNEIQTKSYEADTETLMDITFERSLDLLVIARAGYTVLDLISDIGGILGILMSAAGTFLFAWCYNSFDNYMVTKLYRVADSQMAEDDETKGASAGHKNLKKEPWRDLKEFLKSITPSCLWCCGQSRTDRSFEIGRAMLECETNIVQIIKSRRFFAEAMQVLLSDEQFKILQERSAVVVIDPDSVNEDS